MQHIDKASITRDPSGRTIAEQSEHLSDDGQGNVRVVSQRSTARCGGCRRVVADFTELRGVCDWCRMRGCCVHCISQCRICSRRLCGHCRCGFAAPATALTVCPVCQHRLTLRQGQQDRQMMRRQAWLDRLAMERLAFERELACRRQSNETQALRLRAQGLCWATQLQTARLRLGAGLPPFPLPPKSLPRRIMEKVIDYAARIVR
jgi:hypothetical protein